MPPEYSVTALNRVQYRSDDRVLSHRSSIPIRLITQKIRFRYVVTVSRQYTGPNRKSFLGCDSTAQNGQELCMALCCQNRVSKGTNQCYGLHDSANISVHSASVTVLGLLKKKDWKKQNGVLAVFKLAT